MCTRATMAASPLPRPPPVMPFAPLSPPRLPRAALRWLFAGSGACLLTLLMLASLGLGARGWQPAALAPALAVLLRAPPRPTPVASPATPPPAQPISPRRPPPATRATPASAHPAVLAVPAPTPQVTTPVTQAMAPAETERLGAARTEARPTATQATTPPPAQPGSSLAERCPTQVAPRFPAAAQADDITEGRVLTRLQLDAAGTVVGVEIVSAEPAGYFEREVRHATLKWRCGATGQAETLRVPFHFQLK